METPVYIFMILLDVFISFTIFAIYFYVLFKYFMHKIETDGILKEFKIHLNFYKPILILIKQSNLFKTDNYNQKITNLIQSQIDNVSEDKTESNFTVALIAILSFILVLFVILIIFLVIFWKKIIPEISFFTIGITIFTNFIFIVGFELLFILYVYGNLELTTIGRVLNIM